MDDICKMDFSKLDPQVAVEIIRAKELDMILTGIIGVSLIFVFGMIFYLSLKYTD